ncbi:MAG: hypothetical protein U1F23_12830 [Lysobacterales bacterium]
MYATLSTCMDWLNSATLAPESTVPIEFEAGVPSRVHRGYFERQAYVNAASLEAFPAKLVRRWRYLDVTDNDYRVISDRIGMFPA